MDKVPEEIDGFKYFIERSKDRRALEDDNWRLGFELKHRELNISTLAQNIFSHLNFLAVVAEGDIILDIGAGGGQLALELEMIYSEFGAKYIMIDLPEVLNMGFTPQCKPIYGAFPININDVETRVNLEGGNVKHVIANSVLHYVKHDDLIEDFFASIIGILNLGSAAFIGDVPTSELKMAQSQAEDRTFVDSANNFSFLELTEVAGQAAKLGASIFFIPQPREFPMSPHRLDLLLFRNEKSRIWN
jgi:hypothetical protein